MRLKNRISDTLRRGTSSDAKLVILHGKRAEDLDFREAIDTARRKYHGELLVRVTWEAGDVDLFVSEALKSRKFSTIVAAGGDGTLNEVISALLKYDAPRDVSVALMPMGTSNDFAAVAGIPLDLTAALDLALHPESRHPIDVGLLNGKVFMNTATIGASSELGSETSHEFKSALGPAAYLVTGAGKLLSYAAVKATLKYAKPVIKEPAIINTPVGKVPAQNELVKTPTDLETGKVPSSNIRESEKPSSSTSQATEESARLEHVDMPKEPSLEEAARKVDAPTEEGYPTLAPPPHQPYGQKLASSMAVGTKPESGYEAQNESSTRQEPSSVEPSSVTGLTSLTETSDQPLAPEVNGLHVPASQRDIEESEAGTLSEKVKPVEVGMGDESAASAHVDSSKAIEERPKAISEVEQVVPQKKSSDLEPELKHSDEAGISHRLEQCTASRADSEEIPHDEQVDEKQSERNLSAELEAEKEPRPKSLMGEIRAVFKKTSGPILKGAEQKGEAFMAALKLTDKHGGQSSKKAGKHSSHKDSLVVSEEVEEHLLNLTAGNNRQVASFLQVCPDALLDDGLLDITYLVGSPLETFTDMAREVMAKGLEGAKPTSVKSLRVSWLEVHTEEVLPANRDGELVEPSNFYRFDVLPQRVIMHLPDERLLTHGQGVQAPQTAPHHRRGFFKDMLAKVTKGTRKPKPKVWLSAMMGEMLHVLPYMTVALVAGFMWGRRRPSARSTVEAKKTTKDSRLSQQSSNNDGPTKAGWRDLTLSY